MIEYATNLTRTTQNIPSILEIIAQKSLNDSFTATLQKILMTIYGASPEKLQFLYKHNDKIILFINISIQLYYLKKFDSSFSEQFYGMKRILKNGEQITKNHRLISAIYLGLEVYLKKKLEEKFIEYQSKELEGISKGYQRIYNKIYNILKFLNNISIITNYFIYMYGGQSQFLMLKLIGMKLVYDENLMNSGSNFWVKILEVLAFSTQFLQVLNTVRPNFNLNSLPKVSKPMVDRKSMNFKEKCPNCHQYWKLPTVLQVSGYVYCFSCILNYLKENQSCPVTKLPAKPLDIIRIFDTQS